MRPQRTKEAILASGFSWLPAKALNEDPGATEVGSVRSRQIEK